MSPIIMGIAKKLLWGSRKGGLARRVVIAGAPFVLGYLKKKLWKKRG